MPHCIIDCPAALAQRIGEHTLLATVHDALDSFGVFKPGDIKVRLNGFTHYRCGSTQDDFVHVALYPVRRAHCRTATQPGFGDAGRPD